MSNRELRVSVDSNMEDLKKELASLRLDDEPPRSRRGAWVVIALLVFMVAAGTIFWWGHGVFAATAVETRTPRVERSGGPLAGTPLLTASGYVVEVQNLRKIYKRDSQDIVVL